MTLASPSDFAAAHHAAYQAVGRVLGRVTGSRAIEAVRDGFVVAVEVEGYAEPFEVAAGYEKRRGWVAELRDGTGRVWAVGAGARLPEAVASMGRAGNPPLGGGDERLRRLERAVRADPSDDMARDALERAQVRVGIREPRRAGLWVLSNTTDLSLRTIRAGIEGVLHRLHASAKKIRTDVLAGRRYFEITPSRHQSLEEIHAAFNGPSVWSNHYSVIVYVDPEVDGDPYPHISKGLLEDFWVAYQQAIVAAMPKRRRRISDNPPSTASRHWSSRGPANRKIYAKGQIPRTTRTSPHLKKLYNGLLKHYTKRVAETKRGRTWDEVAAILKIRPKGRASVALWGRALAERVFYAKLRGLAFSKDMIRKLPREGM